MKERATGLGKRLLAYAVMVIAAILVLRFAFSIVVGFAHTIVLVAVVVFAIYAYFWARSDRDPA